MGMLYAGAGMITGGLYLLVLRRNGPLAAAFMVLGGLFVLTWIAQAVGPLLR